MFLGRPSKALYVERRRLPERYAGCEASHQSDRRPVVDSVNIETAGPRGPALLQDVWLIEKLALRDRHFQHTDFYKVILGSAWAT
ncbi:MAG TPA: hypothetical protein VEJ16_03120 [Alphaproteobacteria bacterium]|nr:hypothetical protein [Alphaproteobacteria bacterium]